MRALDAKSLGGIRGAPFRARLVVAVGAERIGALVFADADLEEGELEAAALDGADAL